MLIASKDRNEINKLKMLLKSEFEMKDLGEAKKILGMKIERDRKHFELKLTRKEYIRKMLCRLS